MNNEINLSKETIELLATAIANKILQGIDEDKKLMRLDYEAWHKKVYGCGSFELAKKEHEERGLPFPYDGKIISLEEEQQ